MIEITVDRNTCQGYGNCVLSEPDTFDVDDDGKVTLLRDRVSDERLTAIRQAAYDCPTEAISYTTHADSAS